MKIINDKINNNDLNFSKQINNIKNDFQNIDTKTKNNNYMIIISNLEREINQIKKDIKKYHLENENNKIINNIEFGQENKVKVDYNNRYNNIKDNDEELESEKDYNKIIKNDNKDNKDMIDIMASGNYKINLKDTFVTLAKNSINIDNNNDIINESERNSNKNNSISNNKPIGEAPIPIDKESPRESENSLDDCDIEEI